MFRGCKSHRFDGVRSLQTRGRHADTHGEAPPMEHRGVVKCYGDNTPGIPSVFRISGLFTSFTPDSPEACRAFKIS